MGAWTTKYKFFVCGGCSTRVRTMQCYAMNKICEKTKARKFGCNKGATYAGPNGVRSVQLNFHCLATFYIRFSVAFFRLFFRQFGIEHIIYSTACKFARNYKVVHLHWRMENFSRQKKRTKCSEQEMLRGKLSDGSLAHTFSLRMPIAIRRENACSTTIHASADAIKITLNCDKKYPNKN